MQVTQGTSWILRERCWTERSRPPRSTGNQSMLMLGTSWTRVMQWTVWMSLIISTKRLCILKLLWALSIWTLLPIRRIDLLLTMKFINNSSQTLTCEVQECECVWLKKTGRIWCFLGDLECQVFHIISATFESLILIDQLVPINDNIEKWIWIKSSPYKLYTKYMLRDISDQM